MTARDHVLLTGCTGLLGSYLLRDLLLEGRPVAVLVRDDRKRSAGERVVGLIRRWETMLGKRLPDPVVIPGELLRPGCGIAAADREWIARHCDELVHNAASLSFRGGHRGGEPWATNVAGTRHVLDLVRAAGLRHVHHVSTAYVCGLRTGTVREDELDVGQAFGNDYERSKAEAEGLVHAACGGPGGPETATVYRPSIIVGDSRTAWTSTFHGFYAVLRLGHTLLARVVLGSTSGPALMRLLGVAAHDTKNFVPVDWVSAAVVRGVVSPAARGRTYHLTHPAPVPAIVLARVVQQAVESYSPAAAPGDPEARDEGWFAASLASELDVYRSYMRSDPVFDRGHAAVLAADLPCPVVDEGLLLRMARFAIEHDFGRRAADPAAPAAAAHKPPSLARSWK